MSCHIGLILEGNPGWMGGVDYIRNLVLAVGSLPEAERRGVQLTLLHDLPLDPALHAELSPHLKAIANRATGRPPRTLANRIAWSLRRRLQGQGDPRFARFVRDRGIDFLYPYGGRPGRGAGFRSAGWIPDFQHRYLTRFFTPEDLQWREGHYAAIAESAPRVVLSSEAAAGDFRRFYPAHATKACVMPFAPWIDPRWTEGDPATVQSGYCLPDRFFLICNQLWQHKNHLLVLEVLRRLKEAGTCPQVVCTGNLHDYRQPEFLDEVLQSIHRFGLAPQVHLLGVVPRAAQMQLMRRCLAVLQPSLFEGWSTVVELAKCLGRPLLLSDLDVHREQCPGGPFFERESANSLAALLGEAWGRLEPGPDLSREAAARLSGEERCREFARRFLELAASDA